MTSEDTHDLDSRIRVLAYELREQAGKPDGQEQEFWERAEQMLSSDAGPNAVPQAQLDALTT